MAGVTRMRIRRLYIWGFMGRVRGGFRVTFCFDSDGGYVILRYTDSLYVYNIFCNNYYSL